VSASRGDGFGAGSEGPSVGGDDLVDGAAGAPARVGGLCAAQAATDPTARNATSQGTASRLSRFGERATVSCPRSRALRLLRTMVLPLLMLARAARGRATTTSTAQTKIREPQGDPAVHGGVR
jgi:hypothetical protein